MTLIGHDIRGPGPAACALMTEHRATGAQDGVKT